MLNKKLKMIGMSGIVMLSLVLVTGCAEFDSMYEGSTDNSVDALVTTFDLGDGRLFNMPNKEERNKYTEALVKIGTEVEVKESNGATFGGKTSAQIFKGWKSAGNGCDTRDKMINEAVLEYRANNSASIIKYEDKSNCKVLEGTLYDPYTDTDIDFVYGTTENRDGGVQIDHVVAANLAYQEGASEWTEDELKAYYNDPFVLIAVQDSINSSKGNGICSKNGCNIDKKGKAGDSDEDKAYKFWVPPNINYRCEYAYRQVTIREKYGLWMLPDERDTYSMVLSVCAGDESPLRLIGK
ncbi:MAG: HNH endonuclease family protein [Bifidobacteriaceae bacterium]|jgi:hypothetical protein|nr:HNH endonuclease family protein [Bifidobacteriaceae bacterium]